MGLFDFLFGKKEENTTVVFGVEEILPNPNDSEDLVVIGLVRGTIHVGDEVIITNLGVIMINLQKLSYPHLKTRIKVK